MKKPPVESLLHKLLTEPLDAPPDWLAAWAEGKDLWPTPSAV